MVHGPGEASVALCFSIGVRGKRSTVGVDFRAANGDVKAVIEALLALLREAPAPAEPAQLAAARA